MKIETGKYYRLGNGEKAYVAEKSKDMNGKPILKGWCESDDSATWDRNGMFWTRRGVTPWDIVAEWNDEH